MLHTNIQGIGMRIGDYTLLGRYVQQPSENRRRLVNAAKCLDTGETITSVTVSIDNTTSTPFVVDQIIIASDGDKFAYYASGGVDGEEYTATFTITTSADQVLEVEIGFNVKEIRRG